MGFGWIEYKREDKICVCVVKKFLFYFIFFRCLRWGFVCNVVVVVVALWKN